MFKVSILLCSAMLLTLASTAQGATVKVERAFTDTIDGTQYEFQYPSILVTEAANQKAADLALIKAQGYEHAHFRLSQMDVLRRAVTGRLAELAGVSKLNSDLQIHAVGIPLSMNNIKADLEEDKETWELLTAYCEGVNQWMSEHPAESIEPWKPADTIAIAQYFSYSQGSSLEDKLVLGAIFRHLKETEKKNPHEFFDFRPLFPFQLIKDHLGFKPSKSPKTTEAFLPPTYQSSDEITLVNQTTRSFSASNAWAISKKKLGDTTAASLLASDPHLPNVFPTLFFPMTLHAGKRGSIVAEGVSVAGIPGMVIGRTPKFAWGMTNAMEDQQIIFVETLNEAGTHVKFNDQWVKLDVVTFQIPVAGGETESHQLRIVPHHGPIFSDHWQGIGLEKNTALSSQWACAKSNYELRGMFKILRAKHFDDFKVALKDFCGIGGNFVYADTKGNIGLRQQGRYFNFSKNLNQTVPGYIPTPGTGKYEINGYREKMAEVYNPANGYIVVTNDDLFGRNEIQDSSAFRSTEGTRSARIRELVENEDSITLESTQKHQFDHLDLAAGKLTGFLKSAAAKDKTISETPFVKALLKWNFVMSKEKVEPTYYHVWFILLAKDYFEHIGKIGVFEKFAHMPVFIPTLYHGLVKELELQPEQFIERMKRVTKTTQASLGKLGSPTWGKYHRFDFADVMSTDLSALSMKLKTLPERDGSWLTVDVSGFFTEPKKEKVFNKTSIPKKLPSDYGAQYRSIVVLRERGDSNSYSIVPSSGHELDLYCTGKLRKGVPLLPLTESPTEPQVE